MSIKLPRIDIDCIIPAAGLSSRMGKWKLMLPYNDRTLLENSVSNALEICSRVIVVAGYRADEVVEKMRLYPNVTVVVNQDYQQGMLTSIKLGLKHVSSEHFFITHADMPCIDADIYKQLWQKRSQSVTFPGDEQQSGHPVLIPITLQSKLIENTEHSSMRSLLRCFPARYLRLTDTSIHFDVDTPAAYQKLSL